MRFFILSCERHTQINDLCGSFSSSVEAVPGSITFFSSRCDVFDCRDERCFVLYNDFCSELKATLLMISRKQMNGSYYLTDMYVKMKF